MAICGKVLAGGIFFAILAVAGADARGLREPPPWPFGKPVVMKLLTANQGWVLTNDNYLLWTTTGGTEWRDISPPTPAAERAPLRQRYGIYSVFFLDSRTGWVLFHPWHLRSDQSGDDGPEFSVASTTDGGATWSMAPVDTSEFDPHSFELVGGGHIAFADSLHGWINLNRLSSSNFRLGIMLKTSDGGRTWQAVDSPGVAGSMALVTPDTGWLVGGPNDLGLYVTRDAAKSWQRIELRAPKEIYPGNDENETDDATDAMYDLPVFTDAQHGFLAVTYPGGATGHAAVVLFKTQDGGLTWTADRLMAGLPSLEVKVPSAIAAPAWLIATVRPGKLPALFDLGPNPRIDADPAMLTECVGYSCFPYAISFVSANRGWLLRNDGTLLSTSDGAATWTKITPGAGPSSHGMAAPERPGFAASRYTGGAKSHPASASQLKTSKHLGFDKCGVPNVAEMQAWWNSSPYFDVAFYANGAASQCGTRRDRRRLTSAWVSEVSGQGWGLIPVWSGPQAPCACFHGIGTYPHCELFPHRFSSDDPVNAGQTQARLAAASVEKLGLTGTVIYYDMEGYANSCRDAVVAFLGGWVTGLTNAGYRAGAYGSASNVAPDFVDIAPPLNDVWIASVRQRRGNDYDNVTVWGIHGSDYGLDDTVFANSQRIRQYSQGHPETWGGMLLNIDADIEDADVAGGGGTKTYSFNDERDFQPGGPGTQASLANGINDGVDGVLVPGMPGMVVGYYADANGYDHGFVYNPNTRSYPFPTVDCAGAKNTQLQAINNVGTAVGYHQGDAGSALNAFYFDTISGGGCKNLCSNCVALGINDAGWIVGMSGLQAFVYKNGKMFPFSYPGAQETIISGIDGQGRIAGTYSRDQMNFYGFTGDASTNVIASGPAFSCSTNNNTQTTTGGTNSNGQVTGYGGGAFFLDANGGCALLSAGLYAYGLNDDAQIVGQLVSPANEGFVLLPPH